MAAKKLLIIFFSQQTVNLIREQCYRGVLVPTNQSRRTDTLLQTRHPMSTTETLKQSIVDYSAKQYPATEFAAAVCVKCDGDEFELVMNEEHGVAARICTACHDEHGIGDSDDYFDTVDEVFAVECRCLETQFRIVCGVALYPQTEDVRWFYLACECTSCGLAGVYGDWKNEFIGFRELLSRV